MENYCNECHLGRSPLPPPSPNISHSVSSVSYFADTPQAGKTAEILLNRDSRVFNMFDMLIMLILGVRVLNFKAETFNLVVL